MYHLSSICYRRRRRNLCPTMIPIHLAFSHIFFLLAGSFFILFFGFHSLAPHKSHKSPLIVNISHIHRDTHTYNTSNPDEKTTSVLDNKSTKPRNLREKKSSTTPTGPESSTGIRQQGMLHGNAGKK